MPEDASFSFGKNWKRFLGTLNEERFNTAQLSLAEFLGLASLKGLTFIDLGCGSGLFSHGAFQLGAERVVSIDLDPFSVECCRYLHERAGSPANWEVRPGSVLDSALVSELGAFDIVYSWGVLHHTGRMWAAISNAGKLVRKGGYFYISIYNNVGGIAGSGSWVRLKRFYNRSPAVMKRLMEGLFMLASIGASLAQRRNPMRVIRDYKSKRGMDWKTDIIDWLGGYPYEYATVEEIFRYMKEHHPEFRLVNIKTTNGLATNWFLFQRDGD